MKELKFFKSKGCNAVVEVVMGEGNDLTCCGEAMVELKANTTDAAGEKHVPVIEKDGNKVVVKVGSVAHPMLEKHYIGFVVLQTEKAVLRVDLEPGQEPVAEFVVPEGDKAVAAYEYCNLHGLWKAKA